MDDTILFVGGGNMGRAMIGGLVGKGYAPARIVVVEPDVTARERLASDYGVRVLDAAASLAGFTLVVLAVKPQVMQGVLRELPPPIDPAPVFVSVAAGITTAQIIRWLGRDVPVVRVMPNTPALIGHGAAALYATAAVDDAGRNAAAAILEAVGIAEWVTDESLLDAVTALSGSGPAYVFLLLELLGQIGHELGLDARLAERLALETVHGAALLARESGDPPARLRTQVTSPGGTTERALHELNEGDLAGLLRRALTAARDRSRELAADSEA